jgi:2,4-dienoyl-CoA reductase (NADPH2)
MFPHPLNPPGPIPFDEATQTYDSLLSSGAHTLRNYVLFRFPLLRPLFRYVWNRTLPQTLEGVSVSDAYRIKQAVKVPVISTGGFQTASTIRAVIQEGLCDAVSIARPLLANYDLPKMFAAGKDRPDRPCTYCNKCLLHVLENPLGCYELSRYDGDRDAMMRELMAFYEEE